MFLHQMQGPVGDQAALALGLVASLLAFTLPAHAEKRVVIGNKNVPKLQKAFNDARSIGDTLKQLGFSVMVAENRPEPRCRIRC
jgi:hypothetical protein